VCSNPQKLPSGQKVACGSCNECIAVKKWDWVSRAVAETASAPWGGVVTLTYDNSELSRHGRTVFFYDHVQRWVRSLRDEIRDSGGVGNVRYIVAGENGSKKKRVHWHVLLWSTENLFSLGKYADFEAQWRKGWLPSAGPHPDCLVIPTMRKRLVWSKWPYGHVFLDRMDRGSAEYVLKYAIKDQFNSVKSRGTARENKADSYGASFFRMSKMPPVGYNYLQRRIGMWMANGQVPPDGLVTVEGLKGKWYPRGFMRDAFIEGLAVVYNYSLETRGKPPAGWSALMGNWVKTETGLRDIEAITGVLEDAAEKERQDAIEQISSGERIFGHESIPTKYRVCGRAYPCDTCLEDASDGQRLDYHGRARELYHEFLVNPVAKSLDRVALSKRAYHPGCKKPRGYEAPQGKPLNGEKLFRLEREFLADPEQTRWPTPVGYTVD
jgi:hypothetical protein